MRIRLLAALVLTAMLLSLAGIPLTAGFVGKFLVLAAGVSAELNALVIILVVNSTIGLFYYLRVVVTMYMHDPVGEDTWAPVAPSARVALAVSAVVTLALGIYPAPVLTLARIAARSLL